MRYHKFSERIGTVTLERLGVTISAHRFRVCAATTIAEVAPEQARIIQPLLGHATAKVADRAYNQARMRSAVEAHADIIDALIDQAQRKR